MRVSAEFINTDSVEASLTITMPLGDWKHLASQLPHAWPSWKLSNAIAEAVGKLESKVSVDVEQQP